MVTFRHDDTGPDAAVWRDRLQRLSPPELTIEADTRLLLLAAHPDDETLGAAGLLAEVLERGGSATVVVLTDGEGSHPRSATWTAADLAVERRREVSAAVAHLGLRTPVRFLGVPDGHVSDHRDAVLAALDHDAARCTWIAAPWRADNHPDHDTAGAVAATLAARSASRFSEYPVWFWHWGARDPEALPWSSVRRLPMSERTRQRKQQALTMHRTQTAPLSDRPGDETLLSAAFLDYFTGPDEIHLLA